ncbi:lactaldehyde dehydrogenase [Klebsiella variicola]|uniref:Lactaldehyde dehydrogenase n=1 Tax=Klebsiella variicola TaxID=244366 RepID=A0A7H4MAK5_KLEVA|nr:lactaldehyde dehydrogenase [Klebsiella variicola]
MTSNAVIIDSERQVKEVIIDPNLIPDIAVDDASVMLDIRSRYRRHRHGRPDPRHRGLCLCWRPSPDRRQPPRGHSLINLWLPKAVDDGHDLQAREQMAFANTWRAWRSIAPSRLVHAPGHQPGATHNLPHGCATPSCCRSSKTLTARTRWRASPAWRRRWRRYPRHER